MVSVVDRSRLPSHTRPIPACTLRLETVCIRLFWQGTAESAPRAGLQDFQATLNGLHARVSGMDDPAYWRRPARASAPASTSVISLHGTQLQCAPGVQVVTGPVIGRVSADTALVLLEVSVRARVTAVVLVVTLKHPEGRVVSRTTLDLPAKQPRAFVLRSLVPGKRHIVVLAGVCREDAAGRVGCFTAAPATGGYSNSRLRTAVLSGAAAPRTSLGQWDAWDALHRDVVAQSVDLLLHVGGQVGSTSAGHIDCPLSVPQPRMP